jgi:hypothetical protein
MEELSPNLRRAIEHLRTCRELIIADARDATNPVVKEALENRALSLNVDLRAMDRWIAEAK